MPKGKTVFVYRKNWLFRYWYRVLFLIVLGFFVLLIPGQNVYTVHSLVGKPLVRILPMELPTVSLYPVNRTGSVPGPEITSWGIIVLDVDSGVYLYKRNEEELLSPASTTKILTALVALDHYQLDDVVTVRTIVNEGQKMDLIPGERMTVENLLYGTLIHSANDAAYALAENFPEGLEGFVRAMNEKARVLHLSKSTFTNPVGYDDPNHKMTALDLARLASFALTNKTIAKMVAIPAITISDVTHTYYHSLKNVNQLLGKIPGVGGIKTGWTEEAGENLVTLVERNGHRIIIVTLRSADRFTETGQLIDWVFSNFQWQEFSPKS